MLAYSVLLRAEIARFTLVGAAPRPGWLFAIGLSPDAVGLRRLNACLRTRCTEHPDREPRPDSSLLL
jgi:hypothetical protein